jgi:4-hydroxythreonine-4-phosphate dehydrogenase
MSSRPRIGITLGDPSGIGPEIVALALAQAPADLRERVLVFGDRAILERGAASARVDLPPMLEIIECGGLPADQARPGQPSASGGAAQVAYLERATEAAKDGAIAGLVTAPISKSTARAAHFGFNGHTDFLAARMGASRVAMMFAGPRFKVVLATAHMPLSEVAQAITVDAVSGSALMAIDAMRRDFGVARPRVGVLGLNPHAGEGGMFGPEEIATIAPAVEIIRRRGGDVEVTGPLVPDAAFRQPFDLFVAMYHDQALIPVKLVDFEASVNVTLGLPIVRTSPDHGVAYDIAGQGVARPTSMIAALELCARCVAGRQR